MFLQAVKSHPYKEALSSLLKGRMLPTPASLFPNSSKSAVLHYHATEGSISLLHKFLLQTPTVNRSQFSWKIRDLNIDFQAVALAITARY